MYADTGAQCIGEGSELPFHEQVEFNCAFRRSRPGIPSEGGRPFQLKPARDSDDPGHL